MPQEVWIINVCIAFGKAAPAFNGMATRGHLSSSSGMGGEIAIVRGEGAVAGDHALGGLWLMRMRDCGAQGSQ